MTTPFYRWLDRLFVSRDLALFRRSENVTAIPPATIRYGGKVAYGEWCHVIGLFQGYLRNHLPKHSGNSILDVGCGMGLLGMAVEPYLGDDGRLVGIDVNEDAIRYCRSAFQDPRLSFQLLTTNNAMYSPDVAVKRTEWDLAEQSFDLVTALSVWTHFQEPDARFYMNEVARVLRPGGLAMITMFVLDSDYEEAMSKDGPAAGSRWTFELACDDSTEWYYPTWAKTPEHATAMTSKGLNSILTEAGLDLLETEKGSWKHPEGFYFQDVVLIRKSG